MTLNSNIVSKEWLKDHLDDPDLVILDATLKFMPSGTPIETPQQKIRGAHAFNYDTEICDRETDLPHMLPSAAEFESAVQALGINENSIVVCYDAMGIFSAPRAWWMFKVFGHQHVAILDGGLPQWVAANYPVQSSYATASEKGNFKAKFDASRVVSTQQVLAAIDDKKQQIIDARSQGRFSGQEAEPRAGLRGGHIPGSVCLPFAELLEDGRFKSVGVMQELLKTIIDTNAERQIYTCGSGVTASILAIVADELGYKNFSVYDGSWAEWGARKDLPIEL